MRRITQQPESQQVTEIQKIQKHSPEGIWRVLVNGGQWTVKTLI